MSEEQHGNIRLRKAGRGWRALCVETGAVASGRTKKAALRKVMENRAEILRQRLFREYLGL